MALTTKLSRKNKNLTNVPLKEEIFDSKNNKNNLKSKENSIKNKRKKKFISLQITSSSFDKSFKKSDEEELKIKINSVKNMPFNPKMRMLERQKKLTTENYSSNKNPQIIFFKSPTKSQNFDSNENKSEDINFRNKRTSTISNNNFLLLSPKKNSISVTNLKRNSHFFKSLNESDGFFNLKNNIVDGNAQKTNISNNKSSCYVKFMKKLSSDFKFNFPKSREKCISNIYNNKHFLLFAKSKINENKKILTRNRFTNKFISFEAKI